jgi:hypothetical protein
MKRANRPAFFYLWSLWRNHKTLRNLLHKRGCRFRSLISENNIFETKAGKKIGHKLLGIVFGPFQDFTFIGRFSDRFLGRLPDLAFQLWVGAG